MFKNSSKLIMQKICKQTKMFIREILLEKFGIFTKFLAHTENKFVISSNQHKKWTLV